MSTLSPVTGEAEKARNRRVAWVLLGIMSALALAGLLVGIRW